MTYPSFPRLFTSISLLATMLLSNARAQSSTNQPFPLKEGPWRGAFAGNTHEIPFQFEVKGKTLSQAKVYLLNAEERVELSGLSQRNDSVIIPIELYDAELIVKANGEHLGGRFHRLNTDKPDAGIPFTAEYGKQPRFKVTKKAPTANLSGKWSVDIVRSLSDTNHVVGVFEQQGDHLKGTFLTTTGDYRYLEGTVQGNEFFLSAFSGSGPTLVQGKVTAAKGLEGAFISTRSSSPFSGFKNEKAALPDAYALTSLKEGQQTLDFTFPDLNGKPVSLNDPKYKGKVVVVTLLGSWCPNCVDETAFLAPWYKQNRSRGVEIIGLAFERKDDPAFAKYILSKLIKRFDVQYDILFAGLASKEVASQKLPQLNQVLAFPTTVLIDRTGKVSKIHTGYNGPATGAYYDQFVQEFNEDINQLLRNEPTKASTRRSTGNPGK